MRVRVFRVRVFRVRASGIGFYAQREQRPSSSTLLEQVSDTVAEETIGEDGMLIDFLHLDRLGISILATLELNS